MIKGNYVDGFVLAIQKKNTAKYTKMASEAKTVWMRFGALDYKECVISDPKPKQVTLTFPKMMNTKPGEVVWFSYIVYKNKKHRDSVNKKVMAFFDKKYANTKTDMPFDMQRFAYGGFEVKVSA